MTAAQGGDSRALEDFSRFEQPKVQKEVTAAQNGYLFSINTEQCGIASAELGAGRQKKEDSIDYSAGIRMHCRLGDYLERGDPIATLYSSREALCAAAEKTLKGAIRLSDQAPDPVPLIAARVSRKGVEHSSEQREK